ncbi:MAG: hypothetical protein LBU29_00985, partial [Endomicrobium sp.]|nr:hypothetical protein [Endomicrobium sp.]
AIDYINTIEKKEKVLLLTAYRLDGKGINGIEVIERSKMQNQSVLVTNTYISKIKEFNEKIKFLKLFAKVFINDIPIVV